MNLAREYGAWVDELTQDVNEASQDDPESAQTMAVSQEAELENRLPRLYSLLADAPEDAQTSLNQAITGAKNSMTAVKGLMGQGGPGEKVVSQTGARAETAEMAWGTDRRNACPLKV